MYEIPFYLLKRPGFDLVVAIIEFLCFAMRTGHRTCSLDTDECNAYLVHIIVRQSCSLVEREILVSLLRTHTLWSAEITIPSESMERFVSVDFEDTDIVGQPVLEVHGRFAGHKLLANKSW